MSKLFEKYSDLIGKLPDSLSDTSSPVPGLKLWENSDKKLECFYAPFEHVNKAAKIVLIGITPGYTQMNRALVAASQAIRAKTDVDLAISEVKKEGSFSGTMRGKLTSTLDKIGCQNRLGIGCSGELWGVNNHLVNFCSLLKYPVFRNGKSYNGKLKLMKVPELKSMLVDEFAKDLQSIPESAELIPLGEFVAGVISELDAQRLIPQKIKRFEGRIVALPHPSGANAESISLLLSSQYPEKELYLEDKYRKYLENPGPKKTQPEGIYKATRASRWESMSFVRRAYGIDA